MSDPNSIREMNRETMRRDDVLGTTPKDVLIAAVRDWVQFGAGDGTEDAEAESVRLLVRIAKAYHVFAEQPE